MLEPVEEQINSDDGQGDRDKGGGAPPAKVILELRNVDNADMRAPQPPGQLLWKIHDRNALPLDPSLPLHFAKAVEIGPNQGKRDADGLAA